MGVRFEPCWSSGGYMSSRRAEERSNITTKEELNRLECTPAFKAWLNRRRRSLSHQIDGNYLLGLFLLGIVLLSGGMIGVGVGLGMERPAEVKQAETMKMDEVQPAIQNNNTVVLDRLATENKQLREKVITLENQPKPLPTPFDLSKCPKQVCSCPKQVCSCPKGSTSEKENDLQATNTKLKLENVDLIAALTDQGHKSEPTYKSHLYVIAFLALLLGFLWRKHRVHVWDSHEIQGQNEVLRQERDEAKDEAAYAMSCVRSSKLPTIQEGASLDEIKEKVEIATQEALEAKEKRDELQAMKVQIKELEVEISEFDRVCAQLAASKETYEAMQVKEKELVALTPILKKEKADVERMQARVKNLQTYVDSRPPAETIRENLRVMEEKVDNMKAMSDECGKMRAALKGVEKMRAAHESLSQQYEDMERISKENKDLEELLGMSKSQQIDLKGKKAEVEAQLREVQSLREELEKLEAEANTLEGLSEKKQSLDKFCEGLRDVPQEIVSLEIRAKELEGVQARHQLLMADVDRVNELEAQCRELEPRAQGLPSLTGCLEELKENARKKEALLMNEQTDSVKISDAEPASSGRDQSERKGGRKGKKKKKGKSGQPRPIAAPEGTSGLSLPVQEGDDATHEDSALEAQRTRGLESLPREESDERDQELIEYRGQNEVLKSENLEYREECDKLTTLNQALISQLNAALGQRKTVEEALQQESLRDTWSPRDDFVKESRPRTLVTSQQFEEGKADPVPNLEANELQIEKLDTRAAFLQGRWEVLKQLAPEFFDENANSERDPSTSEWEALIKELDKRDSQVEQLVCESKDRVHKLENLEEVEVCHAMLKARVNSVLKKEQDIQGMEKVLEETDLEELEKKYLALMEKIQTIKETNNAYETQLSQLPAIEKENEELREIAANVSKLEEENKSLKTNGRYLHAMSINHELKNRDTCVAKVMGENAKYQVSATNTMAESPHEEDAEVSEKEMSPCSSLELHSAQEFQDTALVILGDDASPMADEGFTMQPNIYALNKALAALGEDNVLQDEEDLPHRYDPTHLGAIPEEVQGELSEDFVVPAIG